MINEKLFSPLLLLVISFMLPKLLADEKKPQWDVNKPTLPTYSATIDVTEGTWMSVSVSPDGKTILFDLLGDIYRIPFTGGRAQALTSSVAWDMQPVYSPDGRWIAYTSDQGGADNLWLMTADGNNQRPITEESFRIVNNPSWSPDGRFIVGRKHYTSQRSLGAGEIWLFHRNGGTGQSLIDRPNEQKDLGEPAFSPDGRYVYFSQDSTPGNRFEYNKDSNKQIYQIKAIDRHLGTNQVIVSGAGGAVRPTPSPDGKYLAFVRRIRHKTALFLKDLNNQKEWPVYDQLDSDLQETWAINGVYPAMSWTPDSKQVVFWSGGKIKALNIDTVQVRNIPFSVNDKRTMVEALRFKQTVWQESQQVKMARWPLVNAKDDELIFHALGHLYRQAIPDGKAKKLTRDRASFEFYPSLSADGREVIFVSWSDDKLGSIKSVRSSGGRTKTLTPNNGYYIKPKFSQDQQWLYYLAIGNSNLTAAEQNKARGLYRLPTKKSTKAQPELLAENAEDIIVTNNNNVIYYVHSSVEKVTSFKHLVRLDLKTREEKTIAKLKFGSQLSISPSETWLAFSKGFKVYVMPYTESSKTLQLSRNNKAFPTFEISQQAGKAINWSNDSKTIYWSQGASVFSKKLNNVLVVNDPSKIKSQTNTARLSYESDRPDSTLVLENARIITMTGAVHEDGVLVIQGNKIAAVGAKGSVTIPGKAQRINYAGKTIIPGLVDVHWHGAQGNAGLIPQQNWQNLATLAFGVTTIHDPSNNTQEIFSASEYQKAGRIVAPRIFSTGTILYGAKTSFTAEIENLDDAKFHLARMQKVGAFTVKSYRQPRRDQRQQLIAAAKPLKMMIIPEGGALLHENLNMIIDGHTGIEHSLPIAAIYDDIKQLWQQSRVAYTPTLVVAYGGIQGENYWYAKSDVWQHPILSRFVPPRLLQARSVRRETAPLEDYNHFKAARATKQLQDLGVRVTLGAHGQREGLGAHWELWMLAQGGMTPNKALQAATIDGAKYLGLDQQIGSIAAGKLADLVVLNVNPLKNIYASDRVHHVILNGRIYEAATMNELGPYPRKRQALYFEK